MLTTYPFAAHAWAVQVVHEGGERTSRVVSRFALPVLRCLKWMRLPVSSRSRVCTALCHPSSMPMLSLRRHGCCSVEDRGSLFAGSSQVGRRGVVDLWGKSMRSTRAGRGLVWSLISGACTRPSMICSRKGHPNRCVGRAGGSSPHLMAPSDRCPPRSK